MCGNRHFYRHQPQWKQTPTYLITCARAHDGQKGVGTTARQPQPTPNPRPPRPGTLCRRRIPALGPDRFGCARPFPFLPRFIGQNPLRSHHANLHAPTQAPPHYPRFDIVPRGGVGGGEQTRPTMVTISHLHIFPTGNVRTHLTLLLYRNADMTVGKDRPREQQNGQHRQG
jgi:hypothetical protein